MKKQASGWQARFGKVIARAWGDKEFKSKLLKDPTTGLDEMGIRVPIGMSVTIVENTSAHLHLVLPPVPFDGDLDEYELEKLAQLDTPTGFCCTHDCLTLEQLP